MRRQCESVLVEGLGLNAGYRSDEELPLETSATILTFGSSPTIYFRLTIERDLFCSTANRS